MSDQSTAPFQPAKAKLTIGSLDEPAERAAGRGAVQPEGAPDRQDRAVEKLNQANRRTTTGIHLEFTGAEGRSMSVELLFDGYETQRR